MTTRLPFNQVSSASPDQIYADALAHSEQLAAQVGPNGLESPPESWAPWDARSAILEAPAGPSTRTAKAGESPESGGQTGGQEGESKAPDRLIDGPKRDFPGWDAGVNPLIAWADDWHDYTPKQPKLDASLDEWKEWAARKLINEGVKKATEYLKKKLQESLTGWLSEGAPGLGLNSEPGAAKTTQSLLQTAWNMLKDVYNDPSKLLDSTYLLDNAIAMGGLTKGLDWGIGQVFKNLWTVDDSSPMLEQLAHKYAKQLVESIVKDLLKDITSVQQLLDTLGDLKNKMFESIQKKIDDIFSGAPPTTQFLVARQDDKDDKVDVVELGFPRVITEAKPTARIMDLMTPSKKPILEGAAKVLVGGLPVARFSSATAVPSKLVKTAAKVYANGSSFALTMNPDGSIQFGKAITIRGDLAFQQQAVKDLMTLSNTPSGQKLLDSIQNSGKNVSIVPCGPGQDSADTAGGNWNDPNLYNKTGTDAVVYYNPNQTPMYGNGSPWDNPPTAVNLGHELCHASHITNGDLPGDPTSGPPVPNDTSTGLPMNRAQEERRTVGLGADSEHNLPDYSKEPFSENSIRRDLGEPERTSYDDPDNDTW